MLVLFCVLVLQVLTSRTLDHSYGLALLLSAPVSESRDKITECRHSVLSSYTKVKVSVQVQCRCTCMYINDVQLCILYDIHLSVQAMRELGTVYCSTVLHYKKANIWDLKKCLLWRGYFYCVI